MKSTEVRLGNVLKYKKHKALKPELYGTLLALTIDGLIEIECGPGFYEPVPLTPDILEKIGFVTCVIQQQDNAPDQLGLRLEPFTYYLGIWWFYSNQLNHVNPKHLHQLQNLFFALTGEELNTDKLFNS